MPVAVLIELNPSQRAPILGPLGRPAQAWFLNRCTLLNPALGSDLHAPSSQKPYTLSSLLDQSGYPLPIGSWISPGKPVWLRLSVLKDDLINWIVNDFFKGIPKQISLYQVNLHIMGYTTDPVQHPWAGVTRYEELMEIAGRKTRPVTNSENGSYSIRLDFASPTAFRYQGADVPLPYPGSLMRSWWEKWNTFAPHSLKIGEDWIEFASQNIVVSELCQVNTEKWKIAGGSYGVITGFIGNVSLTLRPRRFCKNYFDEWPGALQIMHSLAAFSFYCGSGHHTTIGLGQTRFSPYFDKPFRRGNDVR